MHGLHGSLTVGEHIRVTGVVQGVGFRPAVWRLARECGIIGEVCNDAGGVLILAWGSRDRIDRLVLRLRTECPPLARIEDIIRTPINGTVHTAGEFRIALSRDGNVRTGVMADATSCAECIAEVLDPAERRYRYPFTNCTHCGPRLSIVNAIPYDRANTAMAAFPMCADCQDEYDKPSNRRFHAQPNACDACGPRVWLVDTAGNHLDAEPGKDTIESAAILIRQGHIVAIKGIGGFHLACDAGNSETVNTLRQRKVRYHKAFALMARDTDMVGHYAEMSEAERKLLRTSAAPIVVLNRSGRTLAANIAPGQDSLGFMLPYSPLHHLLMASMQRPIVLTSGNRSNEPQSIDNIDAQRRLDTIADYYLLHDRDIVNRLDDSVVKVADGKTRLLRRARGYAPLPIRLPQGFTESAPILAMGGELKNTFCLLDRGRAILSQHLGDLEDAATLRDYRHNLDLYRRLFDHRPTAIAVDRHPDYLSTDLGRELAQANDIPLLEIQHHHAHLAACLAEHDRPIDTATVLGVVLDGLGYGDDGNLWGGEFLLANYHQSKRLASFQPVPLLGGTRAMHEPWRNTLAHLFTALDWREINEQYGGCEIIRFLNSKPLDTLRSMAETGLNSPPVSSCGRLFDAVAAALDICRDTISYEGQAAIELESLARPVFHKETGSDYGFEIHNEEIKVLVWTRLWKSLLEDLRHETKAATISARFHHTLARAVSRTALDLCAEHSIDTVVLSGGVFQNALLLECISDQLRTAGIDVLSPARVPANDGGISLGQAVIAAARLATDKPGLTTVRKSP